MELVQEQFVEDGKVISIDGNCILECINTIALM